MKIQDSFEVIGVELAKVIGGVKKPPVRRKPEAKQIKKRVRKQRWMDDIYIGD